MFVAILHHPHKPESHTLAHEIGAWLEEKGIATWLGSNFDEEQVHQITAECDLLIVLGGDGSILRAARFAVPFDTPIVGVNMGRIGFLSEAAPDTWQTTLTKVLNGDYWVERRLMLKAELWRQGEQIGSYMALNDIVVGRGLKAHIVRLDLSVDGDHITTYTADGLIAATPTGSTAYSMAAGGPLLPPQLRNFLLLPIAPYLSLDRALVLHETAVATIRINTHWDATLTADGQDSIPLYNGDEVVIYKHDHEGSFARVGSPSYFYRRLLKRLGFER